MSLLRDWNEFWFAEKSPAPLGIYRIFFGLTVLFWGVLAAPPNLYTWYSERGMVPLSFYQLNKGPQYQICLLNNVSNEHVLFALWCLLLLFAFTFTIGFLTRFSAILLFALFLSFNFRDPIILNSGDTMMRCIMFLMLFAPTDASCSVDRLIAIARGNDPGGDPAPVELWTQRLMQVQVALVYAATAGSKLSGNDWMNGTAVYYPLHMAELTRFPLPQIVYQPWMINLLTWGTVLVEASLATLVWNRRSRGYCLIGGVMLHSGIEYALNIPLFSLIMITSYLNFVYNEWIAQLVSSLSRSFSSYKLSVQLPSGVSANDRWWLVISRMDALRLLVLTEHESEVHTELRAFGKGWEAVGEKALRRIVIASPMFWPIAPLLFLPGVSIVLRHFLPHPTVARLSVLPAPAA